MSLKVIGDAQLNRSHIILYYWLVVIIIIIIIIGFSVYLHNSLGDHV